MHQNLQWVNWSHSFVSNPEFIEIPKTEQELKNIILQASENNKSVKVVGSGHSCSLISGTNSGYLIDLKQYNNVVHFDASHKLLTVQGGTSLKKIAQFALDNQLALPNLGTIVTQTISGAMSTGTHGSGVTHEAIDQTIVAFTLITANGVLKIFDKRINSREFNLAVVGIGALGIISTVTIQLVPSYNLSISTQTLSFDEMIINIRNYKRDDYMRFWWAPYANKVQYWKAHRTSDNATKQSKIANWFQDILKGNIVHEFGLWITSFFPELVPRLNKLMFSLLLNKEISYVTDFLDGFTLPILVKQSVMEYGIPISDTSNVLKEIKALLEQKKYKVHMPIEVRFAPSNKAALSMAYGATTCYIGIIAYKPYGKVIDFKEYFKDVHAIFSEYQGRPHWAKVTHYSKEELSSLYPKWSQFKCLKNKLDPKGMFMNDFLKRLF